MARAPHKERRRREIEAVKVAILDAARELALAESWPEVSIRKIAKKIEYTPPVIYEHYKNKEAILIEIEVQGFQALKLCHQMARESESDPQKQLLAISKAHWDWAFKQPEVYQVMFNLAGIHSTPPSQKALADSGQSVVETLRQLQLFSMDTESVFFQWWALVHGFISLVMSGQVHGMNDQVERYMLQGVERMAKSLA